MYKLNSPFGLFRVGGNVFAESSMWIFSIHGTDIALTASSDC